jgi:hypothetical protein
MYLAAFTVWCAISLLADWPESASPKSTFWVVQDAAIFFLVKKNLFLRM